MAEVGVGTSAASQQLKVGDLLVDLEQLRVTRGAEPIALPGLSFDLLVALARAAPRVLSLDELMRQVWPGLIVGSDTISQRVKLLRDALGDDPKAPRYIAGVRGRGYRCVATVEPVTPAIAVAPAPDPAPAIGAAAPAPATRRWRWNSLRGSLALLAIVALTVALAVVLWRGVAGDPRSAAAGTPIPIAVLPFANPDGSEEGRVLAFGVAESILHQLASLPELAVIARTSAFSLTETAPAVRDVAARFNVDYVLQGSVQRDGRNLRITARLIEAGTDRSLWSLRFDRDQQDVFAIQDQIAREVTRALTISVDPAARARMSGQGTRSVEAYLAYLAGQDALATWRTREAGAAATHFDRAVRIDPQFARAWVMLARARLRDAEYTDSRNRITRLEQARGEAATLIEQALALDPELGDAWVERASLRASLETAEAERDYRKAIELSPSSSRAYMELATLLGSDWSRRAEVSALLDRARALDPLSPEPDVTKALHLFYGFARSVEAAELLRQVLAREPDYFPALARLGEVQLMGLNQPVEAIGQLEKALQEDPDSDWTRRMLVQAYLLVGDLETAARLVADPAAAPISRAMLALAEGRIAEAARLAFQEVDDATLSGADQWAAIDAVNLAARRSGDYAAAVEAIEGILGLRWGPDGTPVLDSNSGLASDGLAHAGLLRAAGDEPRAQALLRTIERTMDAQAVELGRVNRWHVLGRARAAALHGDADAALQALEAYCAMTLRCWFDVTLDPLFAPLRTTARFGTLAEDLEQRRLAARTALRDR